MLETSRLIRLSPRAVIHGRNDWQHYMDVMRARRNTDTDHEKHRTYLLDDVLVNSLWIRRPDAKLFVCRSVVKQWHLTGYVQTGLFISASGSSFADTIWSVCDHAIPELESMHDFQKRYILCHVSEKRCCVYCGAGIHTTSISHYRCGVHRSYYGKPLPEYDPENHPHTVHPSVMDMQVFVTPE